MQFCRLLLLLLLLLSPLLIAVKMSPSLVSQLQVNLEPESSR